MSKPSSCAALAALLLVVGLVSACSSHQIGETVSGELLLATKSGDPMAILKNPTANGSLTSYFGYRRHPISGRIKPHRGIDLAAPTGTPVLAAADGTLLFQGERGSYGNLSKIKHGTSVVTAYAHLDGFKLGLTPGMTVEKGQVIGYVGSTGRSSGPHLHYELLIDGEHVDPLSAGRTLIARHVDPDIADPTKAIGGPE